MLNDAETKNLLNRHFDLVILDGAFPECAVSLVHAYRVPFMLINTVGLYTGSLSLAGNPAPYSTTPIFFSSFTDEMNLYQRFLNTVYTVFAYSMHRVSMRNIFSTAKWIIIAIKITHLNIRLETGWAGVTIQKKVVILSISVISLCQLCTSVCLCTASDSGSMSI